MSAERRHLPRHVSLVSVGLLLFALPSCGSRTGLNASVAETADVGPPADCPDSARSIVVLTQAAFLGEVGGSLLRFDPDTAAFTPMVVVRCLPPIRLPTSLTMDREGNLLIAGISVDRQVVSVSPATGACRTPGLSASVVAFGMAFSSDASGAHDTLYLVEGQDFESVDTTTFAQAIVGPFRSTEPNTAIALGNGGSAVYLTGTGAGDLFVLGASFVPSQSGFSPRGDPTASIARIDKATGVATNVWPVNVPDTAKTVAGTPVWWGTRVGGFAFWGGDFYLFVDDGPGLSTVVWRIHPGDGSTQQVAQTDGVVLAAGTSTCAPLK